MSKSIYYSGQYVNADDLNNTESSRISDIQSRTQLWLGNSSGYLNGSGSITAGGILGSPLDYLNTGKNFYPFKESSAKITIAIGNAVDVSGELIALKSPEILEFGNTLDEYTWPTGSVSTRNYIKLAYREESSSISTDRLSGGIEPKRYTSASYITVDSNYPISSEIMLGTFSSDDTGQIDGSIYDKRLYAAIIAPAESVMLDPTTTPVIAWSSFNDHVTASGSAAASSTNPHGLVYSDMSAAPLGTTLSLSTISSGSVGDTIVIGTVYENTATTVQFIDLSALLAYTRSDSVYSRDTTLRIGSSGSTGQVASGGVLSGTTYTLSEIYRSGVTGGGAVDDILDITVAPKVFVPSRWFYLFDTYYTSNDGVYYQHTKYE